MPTLTAPEDRGSRSSSDARSWRSLAKAARAFYRRFWSRNALLGPKAWVVPAMAGAVLIHLIGTNPTAVAVARELVPQSETNERPLALDSLSNGRISLSAYSGRVVPVHFFATWCEPCRAEMAALRRLATRFADKPVAIVAISVAETDARVRRFFETEPDRDRTASKEWQVSTLPTTFVLDRTLYS